MNLSNGVKLTTFSVQINLRGRFPTVLESITRLAARGGRLFPGSLGRTPSPDHSRDRGNHLPPALMDCFIGCGYVKVLPA